MVTPVTSVTFRLLGGVSACANHIRLAESIRRMPVPEIKIAVYAPPKHDLPFLAVVITPDGKVIAEPFDSAAEAQARIEQAALGSS